MMILINPNTGDAVNADSREYFRSLVLDGWKPIGPNESERSAA